MRVLRFLTAGESHGMSLSGIIDGVPAGLPLVARDIDRDLERRQRGHGRGARMRIEHDQVRITSGVRHGLTLGSPIALHIDNRDWQSWQDVMAVAPPPPDAPQRRVVHVPRPGHADYVGGVKFGHTDLRNVLERASARETAMRVALGAVARRLLGELGIEVGSRVVAIGGVSDPTPLPSTGAAAIAAQADASSVRVLGASVEAEIVAAIDAARAQGDTLGGIFEVIATGVPIGLGSYTQWDKRIEGVLAAALMSLNAIKAVEVGMGADTARAPGSAVHDALHWDETRTRARRETNRAGGIEGGITTGEPLVLRAAMKPLATLMRPLASIDLEARTEVEAHVERSDVCSVPAAAVIGEALVALVLADEVLATLGGDSIGEVRARMQRWPQSAPRP